MKYNKLNDPNRMCLACPKLICNHSFEEAKICRERELALGGQMAGTRRSRR